MLSLNFLLFSSCPLSFYCTLTSLLSFLILPTVGYVQYSTPQNTYVAEDQLRCPTLPRSLMSMFANNALLGVGLGLGFGLENKERSKEDPRHCYAFDGKLGHHSPRLSRSAVLPSLGYAAWGSLLSLVSCPDPTLSRGKGSGDH